MNPPAAPVSFLEQASAAPFLFSDAEMGLEYIEDSDGAMRKGEYSAERLFARRPHIYVEIVRLLAEKTAIRAIKRECKVHHCTIQAIAEREGQSIDTLRLSLGQKTLRLAALTAEYIEEALATGKFKPGELAFLLSALVDKGQLLTGGATSRPEVSKPGDVAKTLSDLLDAMPAADAQIVQETHSQTGEKIAVAALVPGMPGTGAIPVRIDSESTVPLCNNSNVTALDAAAPQRGGEGVAENSPPPSNKDA